MKISIFKIGGSILSSKNSYINISSYIKDYLEENDENLFIVVSAIKGATDLLIDYCDKGNEDSLKKFVNLYEQISTSFDNKNLINEIKERIDKLMKITNEANVNIALKDYIVSYGEKLSKIIMKYALNYNDIDVETLDADKIIITNNNYGDPSIDLIETKKALNKSKINKKVFLIEGFIGRSYDNNVTTLGRGGSDYTASSLAYLLNAEKLYLVTDVPGIFSSDPKIVKNPKIVKRLSFEEAIEASKYKVKGINYKTFYPLLKTNVNVYVGMPNNYNTLINNNTYYNGYAKLIGYKENGIDKLVGLIGEGMNKEDIINEVNEMLKNKYDELIIEKNDTRPSLSIYIKNYNFYELLNSIHDKFIGDYK